MRDRVKATEYVVDIEISDTDIDGERSMNAVHLKTRAYKRRFLRRLHRLMTEASGWGYVKRRD